MSGLRAHRAAALIATAALSGCGSPAEEVADRMARQRTGGAGWTLEVAVGQDGPTMDPAYATNERGMAALRNTYAYPMSYVTNPIGPDAAARDPSKPLGELFESLSVDAGGKIWTGVVRKGLTFADGSPVTARSIAFTFHRNAGLDDSGGPFILQRIAHLPGPDAVRAIDDRRVVFETTSIVPMFPQLIATSLNGVVNEREVRRHAAAGDPWAKTWMARRSAGGGAYFVRDWLPANRVVYERNPHQAALPDRPDRVVERIVPSSANRMVLLRRGVVDVALELSPDDFADLRGVAGIKTIAVPNTRQVSLAMNTRIAPFDDKRVRQAVNLAIPYDAIIAKVYRGLAQPGGGAIPLGFPDRPPGSGLPESDMARAKALFESARPAKREVTLEVTNDPISSKIAILVQQSLIELGLDVRIMRLNPNVFAEKRIKRRMALFVNPTGYSVADAAYATQLGYACGGFFNYGEYCNRDVDRDIRLAAQERDRAVRAKLYAGIQRAITEDAPVAWLAQPHFLIATRPGITGYTDFGDRIVRYQYLRKTD